MKELYIFTIKNEKVTKALEKHVNYYRVHRGIFGKCRTSADDLFNLAESDENKLGKFLEKFLLKHINELKKM
jgi:hypothetical protein